MKNYSNTFIQFIRELGVSITKSSAIDFLEAHFEKHSMLAYSDALSKWNIENAAIHINKDQLSEIPTPFVTFFNRNGGTFCLVRDVAEDYIENFGSEDKWVKDSYNDFLKDWSGIVLMAEANEESGERDYHKRRSAEIADNLRVPLGFGILGLVTILILATSNLAGASGYFFLVSKCLFVLTGVMLLGKSIDYQNTFLNKLCDNGGKLNCQSILESPASRITDWLHLSDIGFVYAVGSSVAFLLTVSEPRLFQSFIGLTTLFSLIGVLFSFYSVYYQWVVAKMWCPLCLGFIALFWVELMITYTNLSLDNVISETIFFIIFLKFLIGFGIASAFLLIYKKEAISARRGQAIEKEFRSLKRNPVVFGAIVNSLPLIPVPLPEMGVVSLGNPRGDNILTVVSNPFCGPCARIHGFVEQILKENKGLKCEVVFVTGPKRESTGSEFYRILISLPSGLQERALHEWFTRNDRNLKAWKEPYKDFPENEMAESWRVEQMGWIDKVNIKATPTLYFNGRLISTDIIEDEDFLYALLSYKSSFTEEENTRYKTSETV